MSWARYRSHKVVQASPIVQIDVDLNSRHRLLLEGNEIFRPDVVDMAARASVGDYAVIYEDGYKSVSPKAAFEDGYTKI